MTTVPRRATPWGWIVLGILAVMALTFGACLFGALWGVGASSSRTTTYSGAGPRIALVRVEGVIVSGKQTFSVSYGSVAGSETIANQLDEAAKTADVVAVVLRVNSPGGGVVASDEIYQAVRRVQAAGKPVVVSMGETAASGGYYVSAPADYIVANANTTTGSIGVIMSILNVQGLYDKLGLTEVVIKSDQFKDIGSSTRPMTDEEKAILQGLVDQAYGTFVQVIVDGRKMPVEQVRALADGRIYTGQQALDLKLVDALGGMPEALAKARELANSPDAPLVEPPAPGWFSTFLSGLAPTPEPDVKTMLGLNQPLAVQYLLVP